MSTKDIPAVSKVDLSRYLGKWYEIARLPTSFEKNLVNVTATYNLRTDGKIEVINQGYKNIPQGKKSVAKGKAWIPNKAAPGILKVSFFPLISADYKIIELDSENYQYAIVTSNTKKYLWILSRTPEMDTNLYNQLLNKAKEKGFAIEKIYSVPQVWK